jgi:hypothetical protein
MAGAVVLILVLLFVAPFVLGSYVVVQMFTPRGQVTYFGFVTAFLVGGLLVGAGVLLLNSM